MDSQRDTMTNGHSKDPGEILKEIAQTRMAITNKIHTLEGRVMDKVEDASSTVKSSITSVKQTFDVKHQIGQHPLYWLGGAAIAGFLIGLTDDFSHETKEQIRREIHAVRGRVVSKVFEQLFSRLSSL